jgi:hypothetical protein
LSDYWGQDRQLTQAEKREVLENDRNTYIERAQNEADLAAAGRFKVQQETTIIASKGAPSYPRQPSGPWSSEPVPLPDPLTDQLGYDVNEVDPILPERRDDATSANGLTSAVEKASAPGEPVANRSRDGRLSTPPRKSSFRRF